MAKRQLRGHDPVSDWGAPAYRPPYREIETKIGEELRERYKPPQELPHKMLMLLLEFSGESESGDRSGYA
jgi:hypothetical protein